MKKISSVLAITALLAFGAGAAHAQGIHLGLKGGLNVASLTGDDIVNSDARVGFIAGGVLAYQFGRHLTLQPEVLFARKGIQDYTNTGATQALGSIHLDYLEVPILVKFSMPPSGNPSVRPGFFAGPAFSALLSCSDSNTTDDCKNRYAANDLGVVAGLGLDLVRAFGMLTIDGRVNIGLRDFRDPLPTNAAETRNRSFSVMIGAAIPILR
jgi:hypothetical protein